MSMLQKIQMGMFVFDDINLLSVQDPVRLAAHRVNPYALTFSQTHGETMDFPPAEAELVKLFAGTGEPPIMEAAALLCHHETAWNLWE